MSNKIFHTDQTWHMAEELASEVLDHYPSTGMHGVLHPLRLLGIVPEFCEFYALPATEFLLAAAFHDVGRINDEEDEEHGKRSAELLKVIHPEVSDLVLDMVRNHCCPVKNSKYQVELEFFKDLDAIDRQRYSESNIQTLRVTKDMPYWTALNNTLLPCSSWEDICERLN